MSEPVLSFRGRFRFLSNFWHAPFQWRGANWPSVEHAYQAAKTVDAYDAVRIARAVTAAKAKQLGQEVQLRHDWEGVKLGIMFELVSAKFKQNSELAERLLSTGEAHLEEGNTWGDRYWGTVDGVGQNHLGRILMRVRSQLRRSS